MKQLLKRVVARLPQSVQNDIREGPAYRWWLRRTHRNAAAYDDAAFARYSGLIRETRGTLEAQIVKTYHRLEKGLALEKPRPGFGAEVAQLLTGELNDYVAAHGPDLSTRRGVETLEEHIDFNDRHGKPNDAERAATLALRKIHGDALPAGGGTRKVERQSIKAATSIDFEAFVACRHSVRHFGSEPVYDAEIEAAVRIAQRTPSVCNRQAGQVFVVRDSEKRRELLKFQDGNGGFCDKAARLLIVTARYDCFLEPIERHQCWIDGGMFAMSLVYGLHSQGLGTCCLNWCVSPETDRRFKAAAGISALNAIVMLIAVGSLPETFLVASSARRPLEEVLTAL